MPGFNSKGEVVTLRDICDHIQVKAIVPISGTNSGKCPGAYLGVSSPTSTTSCSKSVLLFLP